MILPMYIFGQPVLRQVAEEVPEDYPNLKELIQNMFETLRKSEGVGLAAPQVGLSLRLFIVDLDCVSDEHPEFKGYLKTFINPEIIEVSKETVTFEEGCLSVPGIHENVKRPKRILVNYLDENFEEHEEWFDDFPARVIQHENDHLDGKMFVDRIGPLRKQMLKSKLLGMTKNKFYANYKCKPNK